jgi:hypothetical protein
VKRGWIVLDDGTKRELPEDALGAERLVLDITHAVKYLAGEDTFRRHEVVAGRAYVFLRDTDDNTTVPPALAEWIRGQVDDDQGAV